MSGQPQTLLYQRFFKETVRRRMRYVNKICFLVAVAASILLRFPYGHFWWNLVESSFRVPVIFAALMLVKNGRLSLSKVEFSTAKSVIQQTIYSIFNTSFVWIWVRYIAASFAIFGVFLAQLPLASNYYVLAKEFRLKPAANDAWVYFWFHAFYCASIYSFQHVIFQRQRLNLRYGVACVKPDSALFRKTGFLLGSALFFAIFAAVSAPFVYFFTRSFIYRINWPLLAFSGLDTAPMSFSIGVSTVRDGFFASLIVFLAWETVNHVFDTYATIGCVDGKTTISARSADPVATLLSGLRDVAADHAWARTTAFQELAYIASSKDAYCVKTRNSIFNPTLRQGEGTWPAILEECMLVIKNTSSRINYRSAADMDYLKKMAVVPLEEPAADQPGKDASYIFGNSHDTTSNDTTEFAVSATLSPLKPKQDAFLPITKSGTWTALQKMVSTFWTPLERLFDSVYDQSTSHHKAQLRAKTVAWRSLLADFHARFLHSTIGVFFRLTAKRDAEARVLNPALYGSAVIAIAGFLMHAVEEDRSNTVANTHISEVLNVLERPIRSSANYTDVLPASVYVQKGKLASKNQHLVAYMHDLTMNEFFQLCVKYNYKLNDLLLSSRAFKLAKWVIDVLIAQQQKQDKSQMETYL